MDDIKVKPELKLMAQFMMQCASYETNNQLSLNDLFFERFNLGEKSAFYGQ